MIKKLSDLLDKLIPWFEQKIPEARLKGDSEGRTWVLHTLDYDKSLKLEDLSKITDRTDLNQEFDTRFKRKTIKGAQGVSAISAEISALYSFNKCAVQRYKGRMHYYRDDLSQKHKRNSVAVGQAMGLFEEFAENLS